MQKVSRDQFFAAVDKAASIDPMPTREYLPIRDEATGRVVGQRAKWETQRGSRVLLGVTETIYLGRDNHGESYFLT